MGLGAESCPGVEAVLSSGAVCVVADVNSVILAFETRTWEWRGA